VPVEDIMLRGRWAVSKSARHYIQEAPGRAIGLAVPAALAARAHLLAIDIISSFTHYLLSSLALYIRSQ